MVQRGNNGTKQILATTIQHKGLKIEPGRDQWVIKKGHGLDQ